MKGGYISSFQLCDMILPDQITPGDTGERAVSRAPSPGTDREWDDFMTEMDKERQLIDQLFDNEIEQFKIYLNRQTPPPMIK